MSELRIDREVLEKGIMLGLIGELDLSNVAAVDAELRVAQRDADVVLLDLSRLDFMDSSGVRIILQADGRARQDGRRLCVLTGSGPPRRLLSILGLNEHLTLVGDRTALY